MMQLNPDECRVLGVLVEKELTTPAQYPLSLNAVTTGCNQKSNRDPVVEFDEDRVLAALESLRSKGLVVFADTLGSRVTKFKHAAQEAMHVGISELVILAELMLRGPQTTGELRTHASRMHPMESLDVVANTLQHMLEQGEPMVRRVSGTRAERYVQQLCPDLHPLEPAAGAYKAMEADLAAQKDPGIQQRVARLEQEAAVLRLAVQRLAEALGVSDVFAPLAPSQDAPTEGDANVAGGQEA